VNIIYEKPMTYEKLERAFKIREERIIKEKFDYES